MNTEFSKKCPKCYIVISYTRKETLRISIRDNWSCRKCATKEAGQKTKGRIQNIDHVRKRVESTKITVGELLPKYTECLNVKYNPNCSGKKMRQSEECRSCSKYQGFVSVCKTCDVEFKCVGSIGQKYCSESCAKFDRLPVDIKATVEVVEDKKSMIDEITFQRKALLKKLKNRTEEEKKENMIRILQDPVRRAKQSKIISEKISSGQFNPYSNHKSGKYVRKDGGAEKYDSLYELGRMIQLDESDLSWTKKHKIRIPYKWSDQSDHNYIPDFLVDHKYIEEVKPETMMHIDLNVRKFKAGRSYCESNNLTYRIITELELGEYVNNAKKYHERNNDSYVK